MGNTQWWADVNAVWWGPNAKQADQAKPLLVEDAAERLHLSPNALYHRIRRRARRDGKVTRAHLGAGIVAVQLGKSWRVHFPQP